MRLKPHYLWTIALLLFGALVVLILAKGLDLDQSKIPSTLVGKQAFPFRAEWVQGREILPNAHGNTFSLEQAKGHILVLNFWASWCVSCKQEAKELEAFWQKFRDRGVLVFGIAIQDTVDAAGRFAEFYGKTYVLGLDVDGRISIDYGVTGVPESFIIDRRGFVVHKEVGPVDLPGLEKIVSKLLSESQGG